MNGSIIYRISMKRSLCILLIVLTAIGCSRDIPPNIVLQGHTERLFHIAFSPNSKQIVTTSADGTARIWCAESGKELKKLEGNMKDVFIAKFSLDGKIVVTVDGEWGSRQRIEDPVTNTVRIWDTGSGKELLKLEGQMFIGEDPHFSPDGKTIVTQTGAFDSIARIWCIDSGNELLKLEGDGGGKGITSFAFSPGGQKIAIARYCLTEHSSKIHIWDAVMGNKIQEFEIEKEDVPHGAYIGTVIFLSDGKKVVALTHDNFVRVWDTESGEKLQTLTEHAEHGTVATLSSDGKRLITTNKSKAVRIWDIATGKELQNLAVNTHAFVAAFFPPDEKRIVTLGCCDNFVRVWDVATGKELFKLRLQPIRDDTSVTFLSDFSPNGKKVATSRTVNSVGIWNLE